MDRQRKHGWIFTLVNFLVLGAALYLTIRFIPEESPKQVSYSEFLAELRAGNMTEVQITERELIGTRKAALAHGRQVPS